MPAMSFTEILGFLEKVIQALQGMRAELAAAGTDADKLIAALQELLDRVVALNEKQESLKRETKATTVELVAVTKAAYARGSGALDTMIAAAGKTGSNAKSLAQIRASILQARRSRRGGGSRPS